MSYTLLNKVPKQIAKPRGKENIVAEKVVALANQLAPQAYDDMTDIGYVPFYSVQSIAAANYNRFAFIQDDDNVSNVSSTGVQRNNRVELPLDFINIYNLNVPDGDQDINTDYFTQNYRTTDLAAEKIEEGINEAFSNLSKSLDLLNANRVLFGHDFMVTTYGSASSQSVHYSGLADVFQAAASDSSVYLDQVGDLDVWGYTSSTPGFRNFDFTQGSTSSVAVTNLKVFAALNTLDWKLTQPNSIFAFGNDSSVAFLSQGSDGKDVKWVIWASKYFEIKAVNYSLYKDLENYYSTGKLIILQEGSLDVESVNRSATVLGLAQPKTISPSNLYLPRDCIGMFTASDFFKGEYALGEMSEEVITVNNLTKSLRKLQTCKFITALPNMQCAIVKIPSLLDDSGTIPG